MVIPDLLKPGDKVAIVSPARKLGSADVTFAANTIASWGLEVVLGKNIFSSAHSYLSGTDRERLEDLQTMIDDASVKCVICARGGYGTTRILDALNLNALSTHPKWIIGFSDITALHLKLFKDEFVSIHATMPVLFARQESASSVESLRRLLMQGESSIECGPSSFNLAGKRAGRLIGGNLSLIVDSIGTATDPDTHGKILVVEEIDEYLYKVDRMMTQLQRSGKLENLAGLIVGHMTDIKDTDLSYGMSVEEIILNAVKDYGYPVAFRLPSGHENPNLAWVHGGEADFVVSAGGASLKFKGS